MLLPGRDDAAIERAAAALAAGELVAFPTETVYGLGARADSDAAVAGMFALKGRPSDHPLIVHVADAADAGRFATNLPAVACRLIDAFWPGPLNFVASSNLDVDLDLDLDVDFDQCVLMPCTFSGAFCMFDAGGARVSAVAADRQAPVQV